MAVAHLEPIEHTAFRLRVGPDGWHFGEPYEVGLVVEDLGEGVASISLLYKPIHPSQWAAIHEVLVGAGFHAAVFERHRAGGAIELKTINE